MELTGNMSYRGPRGYSAYDLAVQDGYTGSQSQWIKEIQAGAGCGIYVGDTEPELDNVVMWIDTSNIVDPNVPGVIKVKNSNTNEWIAVANAQGVASSGASAYEIAKRNGFTGTEKEWLASLGINIEIVSTKPATGTNGYIYVVQATKENQYYLYRNDTWIFLGSTFNETGKISTMESDISSLNSRVTTLTTKVNNLSSNSGSSSGSSGNSESCNLVKNSFSSYTLSSSVAKLKANLGITLSEGMILSAKFPSASTSSANSATVQISLDNESHYYNVIWYDNNNITFEHIAGEYKQLVFTGSKFLLLDDEYVVENTRGRAIKHKNGTMVCEQSVSGTTDITSAWGSWFTSDDIALPNYPVSFVGDRPLPIISGRPQTGTQFCFTGQGSALYGDLTSAGSIRIARPESRTGVGYIFDIITHGKWK